MRVVGLGGGSYFGFSFCYAVSIDSLGIDYDIAVYLFILCILIISAWGAAAHAGWLVSL